MKAEFANPFIRAATDVVASELKVKLSRKDLKLKENPEPSLPTFIIIGVTGAVQGQVVYAMDSNFSMEVAKAMMPGKLPAELKKLEHSAICELANMITGRASIELAGENNVIDITPPAVFTGNGITVDFLNIPTIALSFISSAGVIEVNIALAQA
jgi:chemotaxis protein CheX